jgi:hypothetical protein
VTTSDRNPSLEEQIEEALADASWLRQQGIRWSVDTGRVSPTQVALEIYEWLEHLREQVLKEPETASADPQER